ncbi:hypothetical protein DBR06_SOUSAS16010008, partial [Sousa chinensis]
QNHAMIMECSELESSRALDPRHKVGKKQINLNQKA